MSRAIRLKLDPIPSPATTGDALLDGVRVTLADLGKGASKAKQNASTPAKITFRIALRETARGEGEPLREELGSLTGAIELRGAELTPAFVIAPDEAATALTLSFANAVDEPPLPPRQGVAPGSRAAAQRPKPRALPLDFDASSFEGTNDLPEARLLIPSALLDGFRFMELEAELEVGGATEAAFELNDVLDGRITAESPPPIPSFDLLLIDDVGQPIEGLALRIEQNGEDTVVTTDATGFARLIVAQPATASVLVDDLAALRARMKPLWDKADRGRAGTPSPVDDDTTVFAIRGDESPQAIMSTETPHIVRIQPYVFLARLKGLFFDLNKTFLLRTAIGGLKDVRSIYDANNPSKLLIVGHTDTSGDPSRNDPLSLERARSLAAFLSDDGPTWEKQFDPNIPEGRRWGRHEEEQMIEALPDFGTRLAGETHVAFFHRARSLPAAPALNKTERQQLIAEYMALDGADVKEQGFDIEIFNHGAGENFPLDLTGDELDSQPVDGQHEQLDRRVELYFFDRDLGVQPKVADGSNSKRKSLEYPEWRRRATELREISPEGTPRDRVISVVLLSNSGNLPLANRDVTLTVGGEPPFSGRTDANGVFERSSVPAGDHLLTIDGVASFVAATPASIVQRPHVVVGHVLLPDDAPSSS